MKSIAHKITRKQPKVTTEMNGKGLTVHMQGYYPKSNRLSILFSNSPLPVPCQGTINLPIPILKLNPNASRKNVPLKFLTK